MEKFELVETEEERKERYERRKKELGWPDWKMEACNDRFNTNHSLELENSFKVLTQEEENKLHKLFKKRKKILLKYKELSDQLELLLDDECELWASFEKTNKKICEIEGHRLSKEMNEIIEPDGYGGFISFGYSRTCLVCGAIVKEYNHDDVVVKGETDIPKRVKIKTRK